MSRSQEASKNFGNMCCGPWTHQGNPARKKRIGILLITIGLIWLGARLELIDFSWLQTVYVWPAVLILAGVWMVYKALIRKKSGTIDDKSKGVRNGNNV
jgi:undecaprenyl pyrophosphate phosphatase UppP